MLRKAACDPHKSENLVHAYRRYHLVERCTISIKGLALSAHQTTESDPRRSIH